MFVICTLTMGPLLTAGELDRRRSNRNKKGPEQCQGPA